MGFERLRRENWGEHVEYYKALTDVITVWAVYHHERVTNGGQPAAMDELRVGGYPGVRRHEYLKPLYRNRRVLADTGKAMWLSAIESWRRLSSGITGRFEYDTERAWEMRRGMSVFWAKMEIAAAKGAWVSRLEHDPEFFNISEMISRGLGTAFAALPVIILHEMGNVNIEAESMVTAMTKISLEHAGDALRHIGVSSGLLAEENFELLDPNRKDGLNLERRMAMMLLNVSPNGYALGCPMSKLASKEVVEEMGKYGFVVVPKTIRESLVMIAKMEVARLIDWYKGLDEWSRINICDNDRALLDKVIQIGG